MLSKVYLEITNICNLNCSFCPGTSRKKEFITPERFDILTNKLMGKTEYLYLHLMGEPTLHPKLGELIEIAGKKGFKVCITTNGTLLGKNGGVILEMADIIYKVSISLHSAEANGKIGESLEEYVRESIFFQRRAGERGIISVIRLWNEGDRGENSENERILEIMREEYPGEWTPVRLGSRMAPKIYLEWGERFEWPDREAEDYGESRFCYAIRDHIGILCDGTVVPCCLDRNGDLSLGNLLDEDFDDIISSDRAKGIVEGFNNRHATEEICRKCQFSTRF